MSTKAFTKPAATWDRPQIVPSFSQFSGGSLKVPGCLASKLNFQSKPSKDRFVFTGVAGQETRPDVGCSG